MSTHPHEHAERHWVQRMAGPTLAGLTATFLVAAAPHLGLPGWAVVAPPLAAAAARAGAGAHERRTTRPGDPVEPSWGAVGYRVACWLVPGIWAALVIGGVLHPAVVAGAVLFGAWLAAEATSQIFDPPPTAPDPVQAPAPPATTPAGDPVIRTPFAEEWRTRINRRLIKDYKPGRPGVVFTGQRAWPHDAGSTLTGEFPAESGLTYRELKEHALPLGSAGRLPVGCLIQVREGPEYQGTFEVDIPTRDGLREEVPWHGDLSPKSVHDGLVVARRQDYEWALIRNLRRNAGVLVARRDGGKTTVLNDIQAELCRCTDVLTVMVDMNGGGVGLPWVLPYARGEVDVPGIFWLAADAEEALFVAQVMLAITLDRKSSYESFKWQADSSLLPLSADLPLWQIIIDEGAEVGGDDAGDEMTPEQRAMLAKAMKIFKKIMRIGRDAGVNVIFSGLRATNEIMPPIIRSQGALRIAGQVEDDADLAYLMGWKGLKSEFLTLPGMFYLLEGASGLPDRVRFINLKRSDIGRIVAGTQHIRPQVPEREQIIGGWMMADRWNRSRDLLETLADGATPRREGQGAGGVTVVDMGGAVPLTARPTPPTTTPPTDPDEGDDAGGLTAGHVLAGLAGGPLRLDQLWMTVTAGAGDHMTGDVKHDLERIAAHLDDLSKDGLVTASGDTRKPIFELTPDGHDVLAWEQRLADSPDAGDPDGHPTTSEADAGDDAPQHEQRRARIRDIVHGAGDEGIKPDQIRDLLEGEDIRVSRDTIQTDLNQLIKQEAIERYRHGRYRGVQTPDSESPPAQAGAGGGNDDAAD